MCTSTKSINISIRAILLAMALIMFSMPSIACCAETSRLVILADSRQKHVFSIELALTKEEQAKGLMFRHDLSDMHGMLFPYEEERVVSFWMRNTLIPLDMIFIRRSGEVSSVHHSARPLDETPVRSEEPVYAVLEVPGGTAKTLGIKAGAKVFHPIFGNTLAQ